MSVLKPQDQGLFKFCITVQCHELLSGWVQIQQSPYVMFETTSQFFFELCITFQCHER